jgi:thiamine biosynthesis lipoprotein
MNVAIKRRALFLGFGALALDARGALASQQTERSQSSFAFGTSVRVQAIAADHRTAELACRAALSAIHRVERLMSLYDAGSEISRLNRNGRLARPDPWTVTVLRQAQAHAARSDGAFDATVQPLWRLFQRHTERSGLPSEEDVAAVRSLVGWRGLQVDEAELTMARPGMAITLNGIAQGFAADRACEAMRASGAVAGLVDAGELASIGQALSGEPWSVALQVPHHGREERISLDACVATSADSPCHFSADRRHHHIFDPRSGWSPTALSAVSVVAATATQADAWSTAIMVGGGKLARHALARGEVLRVWLVDKQGRADWVS